MKPISLIAHWFGKQFLSFLVIVFVLAVGGYLYAEIREHIITANAYSDAKNMQEKLSGLFGQLSADSTKRISNLKDAPAQQVAERIAAIDSELARLNAKRLPEVERRLAYLKGDFRSIELDLQVDILTQERNFLDRIRGLADHRAGWERLVRERKGLQAEIAKNESDQADLKEKHQIVSSVPLTGPFWDMKILKDSHQALSKNLNDIDQRITDIKKVITTLEKGGTFRPINHKVDDLNAYIEKSKKKIDESWINELVDPAKKVVPAALWILLGAILTPIGIKGFFYYVLAPLASRRPPICIDPESQGGVKIPLEPIRDGGHISARALEVSVSGSEEILLHPEYLRSVASGPRKTTKWFLDRQYPLSSLASGLFMLTHIKADQAHSCTVAAIEDPLLEIALIEIPEGTRLVLQPRHVVGVVQPCDRPLRISSHWRLKSVTAWMTLQLRYLTFAGPAKILVKGCQGVRVDPSGTGQSLNQASTIGFTANLAYAVRRCDPFVAYLRGKQELFDDNFSGPTGFYISEVTPYVGKKSGITGKGLEGIVDSLLKIVGL